MSRKIIGVTVGTQLPKPNFKQTDPTKGDYIKNKPDFEGLKEQVNTIGDLVGDTKVSDQISEAIASIPTPDVSGQINSHNTATDAHNDIRLLVEGLATRLNALANSDDTTLDQMAEVVAYIKSNRSLIEEITTNKVNVSDVIDNLITNVSNKPLSAAQGVALKALIDALPAWSKATDKPSYTASEVGALPNTTTLADLEGDSSHRTVTDSEKEMWNAKSDFSGDYNDLENKPSIPSIDGLATETHVGGQINSHNTSTESHNDIRLLIQDLANRLNTLANSDDTTLDQMSEVVAYIKNNKDLIDGITTSKVSVADIVNDLVTNVSNKPLSAAQGVALKALIDAITIPTKLSELLNDSGFITGYTETDPTVPSWAKQPNKPSYSASEVGALEKTTYEYNRQLDIIQSGKVCIGKFPMYDSIIAVTISSSTYITYHGTLVIATQNINTSLGGVYKATVYGDADNSLTDRIKIEYVNGSNVFSVYIDLPIYSKHVLHIQFISSRGEPTDIATIVGEIPSTATIVPTNALKAQLDGKQDKGNYAPFSHNQSASTITAGTFAGQVVANASGQSPSISCLRNSRLSATEEDPTVEGETVWQYE